MTTKGIEDAIEPEILVALCMRYKLGGYGKEFFGVYLNQRKQAYRDAKIASKGKK